MAECRTQAPLLRASVMASEAEMEDDGLFMLTLWLDGSPDYLAICRDLGGVARPGDGPFR